MRTMNIKYYNNKAREEQEKKEQAIVERDYLVAQNILRKTAEDILSKHSKK